ncbi:MAG: putative Ig domain-containing protein [Bacteriovoracaceae bacterium]|nr:putative Ig domain-containing protein [Bacteriovoracaceae bacterium]
MKFILTVLTLLSLLAGCNDGAPGAKSGGAQTGDNLDSNFQTNAPSYFNISSYSAGNGTASISWTTSTHADSYELKYRMGTSDTYTTIPVTGTYYILTGLTNGQTYTVYAVAKNSVSETQSNAVTVTPQAPTDNAPVVQNFSLSISEDTERSVTLNYVDSNGEEATSCTVSALSNVAMTQSCACSLGICKVTVKPTANYFGSAGFNFTVSNGLTSNTATATLNIVSVDDAPIVYSITPTNLTLGAQSIITLPYTDSENDLATNCYISTQNNAAVTRACLCGGGVCTVGVTSYQYQSGLASFNYEVRAGTAFSNIGTATLSLNPRPLLGYAAAAGTTIGLSSSFNVAPTTYVPNGAAITSCTISPALPAGVTIDPVTCVISGTPTSIMGTTTYSVIATNTLGSSLPATVSLKINPSAPVLSYTGATGTNGSVGTSMSVSPTTLTTNGTAITGCTISPALPSWATIHPGTCVISGTPTSTLSVTSYTVTAHNAAGSSTGASVTLSVNAAVPTISYASSTGKTITLGNSLNVVPSTLNANGASITNCSSTPALPIWATLNPTTCAISGTPTTILASVTYSITSTNSVGSSSANVTLTVNPAAPTLSYVGALGTSGAVGVPMTVSPTTIKANGSAITSCTSTPALPSWAVLNSVNCKITGTPTSVLMASVYNIRATNAAGTSSAASVTLSVSASAPMLSYSGATGTTGSFGTAMNVSPTTLVDNGSTITSCTISPSLPLWATINTSTCVISGTPNATLASTTYSVVATNSAGSSASANITLRVNAVVPVISYSGSTGTSGTFGSAMSITPSTLLERGAAITSCTSSPALPAWATINSSTCVISGTPNAALSSTTYTITATNSAGSASSTVALSVSAKVPTLSYVGATGANGFLNNPMTITPTTLSGNGASITACSSTPALPAWATIDPVTCVISGTPDAELDSTYIITATNSVGISSGATLVINVDYIAAPTISYVGSTGTTGAFGVSMVVSPASFSANGSSITSCTISPALPAWASIHNTTCEISGTPNAILSSTAYTVTVTNALGSTTANVTLAVNPSVPSLSYAGATGKTGSFGSAMSITPTNKATNGASITNCTSSPALPAGLTINAVTCVISGTPTVVASATTYTITATNSAGPSAGATLTITVNPAVPTLSYAGATGTTGSFGVGMTVSPTTLATNGASITGCSSSPALPAWATLNATTCVITGTPTSTLATTTYTITATNTAGTSAGATVALTVNATLPSLSYAGAFGTTGAVGYAMSVAPTTFSENGSVTACSISPALPAWANINAATCVISGTPDATLASTTYTVTATNTIGPTTANVTLRVDTQTVPNLSYTGATGTTGNFGAAMTVVPTVLNQNGSSITGCTSSPGLPGWATLNATTCEITGTPNAVLSATTYNIRAQNSAGLSNPASVTLTVNALVPSLSYAGATGTTGSFGTPMTVSPTTLNANGATISACTSNPALPTWATLNPTTCVITGTPDAISSDTYVISATNSAGTSAGASVTINVLGAVPNLSYAGATGTTGTFGISMSITPTTLNQNGSAISGCSSSPALPGWATLNPTTCVISGTPNSTVASTTYTITATNTTGPSLGANVTLTVNPAVPILSYDGTTGTNGSIGGPMSISPMVLSSNGATVTTCNITPALPAWASINQNTCVISGTPTESLTTTTYSIVAINARGSSAPATVTISVDSDAPTLSYVGSFGTNGVYGVNMTVTPSVFDNNGISVTSCVSSPALPDWAYINPTNCTITGVPTETLMATIFTITATNTSGNFTDATVTLSVDAMAPVISYSGSDTHGETIGVAMSVIPSTLNSNGSSITSCIASPALPAWATLDNTSCIITGTPPANSNSTHTITATNSVGSASTNIILTAGQQVPLVSYASSTGKTISYNDVLYIQPSTLINYNDPIQNCQITPALPVWATIDNTSCVISGTPETTINNVTYTVVASNTSGDSVGAQVTISVNPAVPTLSFSGAAGNGSIGVPITVAPVILNSNGASITNCVSTPALPLWATLDINTCEISGTPNGAMASTNFTIVATNAAGNSAGAIATLSVDQAVPIISYAGATGTTVNFNQPMNVIPTTLNNNGSAIIACSSNPALPLWATLNATTCEISGTPNAALSATTYTITAQNSIGPSNGATVTLTVNPIAPTLSYVGSVGTNGTMTIPMTVTPTTLSSNGSSIIGCSSSPLLPVWATLNTSTCQITGTPNAVLVATTYTITATNAVGSNTADVTLSVGASAPTISYSGATGTVGDINVPMSVTPTTLNENGASITSCTYSPALPLWASINPTTCVISGTPDDYLPSTIYSITATNSAGSSSANITLAVNPAVPEISYGGASIVADMGTLLTINPTLLKENGSDITLCTNSPTLPAWATLNMQTCAITGTPDLAQAATTYTISAVNGVGTSSGATVTIEVNAAVPTISYAGATGTNGTIGFPMFVAPTTLIENGSAITNCSISPALAGGLSFNASTCEITGSPSANFGPITYVVTVTNGVGSSTAEVTLSTGNTVPSLSYTGAAGTVGTINVSMNVAPTTISNNGSAITQCQATPSLPLWATLNPTTCVITGVPDSYLAPTSYTIVATNSAGPSAGATVTLEVEAAVPTLSYAASTGTQGSIGSPMTVTPSTLNDNGSAISACSVSPGLPLWASLDNNTCVISGTPDTDLSSSTFTITVTNGIGSSTASVTIGVGMSVPDISYIGALGTAGVIAVPMTVTPTTLNENGSEVTQCNISPSLPLWATLTQTTCTITGVPDAVMMATIYTITATNSTGTSTGANVTLSVDAAAPALSYAGATGTNGEIGFGMVVTPTTLNDHGATITGCTASPGLPAWASINSSTCVITGTPNADMVPTEYSVTAVNSKGSTVATVTLSVGINVPTLSYAGATGTVGEIGVEMNVAPTTLDLNGSAIQNCSSSPALPGWLTLNSTTCTITGTPSAQMAAATYTITATNSTGASDGATVTLEVSAGVPTLSYIGSLGTNAVFGVPTTIAPTALNDNGSSILGCTSSPSLPTWATLNATTCTITGTPDDVLMATVYTITAENSSGFSTGAEVTISVSSAAPELSYEGATGTVGEVGVAMTITPTVLNGNGSAIESCTAALPAWASIDPQTCVISGTPDANQGSTNYNVTVMTTGGSSAVAAVTITVGQSVPVISYDGSVTNYNYQDTVSVVPTLLQENGSPINQCLVTPDLPAWATIDQQTCVISGSADSELSATFSIVAKNAVGDSIAAMVTLIVNAGVPELSYTGATGTSGFVGANMTIQPTTLNANGSTITSCISVPDLVNGLTINAETCIISGIPLETVTQTYAITASNNAGSSLEASVTITVGADKPTLDYTDSKGFPAYINSPMAGRPAVFSTNGSPIQTCVVVPDLPLWAILDNNTCEITGTPTALMAPEVFDVTATNAYGSTTAQVTLEVKTCPDGFVEVPAWDDTGLVPVGSEVINDRFCVMQFEAKNVGGKAVSQPASTPWLNITIENAQTACGNLGWEDQNHFDLISNQEWMAIARNIESVNANWLFNTVPEKVMLYTGNSNGNAMSGTKQVSNINDPYTDTGDSALDPIGGGREQGRTFELSNGSTVWDMAGNAWEWVDWDKAALGLQTPPVCANPDNAEEILSVLDGSGNVISDCLGWNKSDFMPTDPTLTKADGVGVFQGDFNGVQMNRGGDPEEGGGIYTIGRENDLAIEDPLVGFRCVFRP